MLPVVHLLSYLILLCLRAFHILRIRYHLLFCKETYNWNNTIFFKLLINCHFFIPPFALSPKRAYYGRVYSTSFYVMLHIFILPFFCVFANSRHIFLRFAQLYISKRLIFLLRFIFVTVVFQSYLT